MNNNRRTTFNYIHNSKNDPHNHGIPLIELKPRQIVPINRIVPLWMDERGYREEGIICLRVAVILQVKLA